MPWRVYHGLDEDFRPLDDPTGEPQRIGHPARYRHFLYGMAKAAAVMEEGAPDGTGPARPSRRAAQRERELVAKGGLILPTSTPAAPR